MNTFWKIVVIVLVVLVVWMAFGKPLPSGLSTDRDRILAEVNTDGDNDEEYVILPKEYEDNEISEPDNPEPDPCRSKAKALGFPSNLVEHVCNGQYAAGAKGPLSSGTRVQFGTITVDNATAVWILHNFIVPNYANYAFEYADTEKNLLESPFLNGKKECFNPQTGLRSEICKVCIDDTTSPGCELEIDFFN